MQFILISDKFHEKIRRQALADQGKRPQAGCRLARVFDDEQRVNGGEDFHGFGQRLVSVKATPQKACLMPLHVICLHVFHPITKNLLAGCRLSRDFCLKQQKYARKFCTKCQIAFVRCCLKGIPHKIYKNRLQNYTKHAIM